MTVKNNFKRNFNIILIGSLTIILAIGVSILLIIKLINDNNKNYQKVYETSNNIGNCQSSVGAFLLNAWIDTSFVKTGTNKESAEFNLEVKSLEKNIQQLKNSLSENDLAIISKTENEIEIIELKFNRIRELIKERGFKDLGIEGRMRKAIHLLENDELIEDKANVLKLRKHEKDFFLRKDPAYLSKLEKDSDKLIEVLNSLPDSEDKIKLINAAQTYLNLFRRVVEIEKEIGLNKTLGLRGEIGASIHRSKNNLDSLIQNIENKNHQLLITATFFIILIFTSILITILVSLNKLVKPVFEPIAEIQLKVNQISDGNLSVDFDNIRNNKVLEGLIQGFEKIIYKFKSTMEQMEGISSKKITSEIPLNSNQDEIGITLNKIVKRITALDKEEQNRAWHNEGLALFAGILRNNIQDETSFYDEIIKALVKYLNANQGAIFLIDGIEENDEHLSLKACYAYNRKKFLDMKINFGEGLAGACWAEKESIYITDVPDNYVRITSGLGEALPKSILIVPVKFKDEVLGIIEIASFTKLEDYQVKFMEAIAESTGSTIHNLNTNTKTIMLLQKSQEMTEEMRAQEEEMRQNLEELQATQEEMERMSLTLKSEMENLNKENQELKNIVKQYSLK